MELVPDEEAIAFEVEAAEAITGGLAVALGKVLARALAAWAAGQSGRALRAVVHAALSEVRWAPMTPALAGVAEDAVALGVERASRGLTAPDRRKLRRRPPRPDVPEPVNLDALTRARVRQAQDFVGTLAMDTKRDLDAVLGKVSSVRSRAEGQARWTANEGINAGTSGVARSIGRNLLWVPERDACLHCLAYAGWTVRPGETFPPSLTFADSPLGRSDGILYPPLHPGCRCQVKTTPGKAGPPAEDGSANDPAAALAREARRSVVYGWTAHASQAATLRAMSRLLEEGANLPASVERRARTLLRQGKTQPRRA